MQVRGCSCSIEMGQAYIDQLFDFIEQIFMSAHGYSAPHMCIEWYMYPVHHETIILTEQTLSSQDGLNKFSSLPLSLSSSLSEKHVILKMLKSAEDAQVQEVNYKSPLIASSISLLYLYPFTQTINDVMQPTAAKAVRKWMKTADNKGSAYKLTVYGHAEIATQYVAVCVC